MKIEILIAYVAGTSRMMGACLDSIKRHDAGHNYSITVVTDEESGSEAKELFSHRVDSVVSYSVDMKAIGSQRHASLLDSHMATADGLILTMDSDCMPIADGWLRELYGMLGPDSVLSGIKWPWEPPEDDVEGFERRIRDNQNWNNTWVACQLVDSVWVRENGLKYGTGDDTGFELAAAARTLGLEMKGWMPTRCALPSGWFDPELNRMMCVVYGDKMVHIGGGSGKAVGRVVDIDGMYDEAIARVLRDKGAEWMLDPVYSHEYTFKREGRVVEYKMKMMYNEMSRYLETHDSVFVS